MRRLRFGAIVIASLVAGCGTAPLVDVAPYDDEPFEYPAAPSGMVEHPPIEPIEPVEPPPSVAPAPEPQPPAQRPPPAVESTPTPTTPPPSSLPPIAIPEVVPNEDHAVIALVADLARYAALGIEEVRRDLNTVTQLLAKQRTDANRVRLAVLYTLTRSPQDDLRALQLLENVAKSTSGPPGMKQLAGLIQAQVTERVRAVREEQQKAEAAIQKLEALRVLERNLLRDRVRSGGGGGGGGGSGSGGSGGGR
ncbi:MAG: hypothetical protein M3Z31_13620 [Pseudomonadota bacterium]|nr:hypothetical protein [Pseudomonadota bacterium]